MSTPTAKRKRSAALADAIAFRNLFPADCYERWEIAGSIRRGKPEVGDVEHVIIPRWGEVPGDGLFAEPQTLNLLWVALEAIVLEGELYGQREVTRHVYSANPSTGAPVYRWGEKYRGVDFRGFNHELFTANADNWGAVLSIRTGPADFSQHLVTALRRQNRRAKDGQVWRCEVCPDAQQHGHGASCKHCQGTGLQAVEPIPVPDEPTFFELCGVRYREPADRQEGAR